MKNNHLNLKIDDKIRIGKKYAKEIGGFESGEIINLVQGYFEYDNGLYCETQTAPSVYYGPGEDFDSIYHLFGNNLENFMDCEVLPNSEPEVQECDARDDDQGTEAGNIDSITKNE